MEENDLIMLEGQGAVSLMRVDWHRCYRIKENVEAFPLWSPERLPKLDRVVGTCSGTIPATIRESEFQ